MNIFLYLRPEGVYFRVMLICSLITQVKEFKMKIKNNFYIESITFATFKTLNAQVPTKTFYIWFLNLCLEDTN